MGPPFTPQKKKRAPSVASDASSSTGAVILPLAQKDIKRLTKAVKASKAASPDGKAQWPAIRKAFGTKYRARDLKATYNIIHRTTRSSSRSG